jgi:ubiquinone/menaquinone biosynthesis C-methylase UbiE
MTSQNWRDSSRVFFDLRAAQVKKPNLKDLCYVSGREPRLWSDEKLYADMIDSIIAQAGAYDASSFLEVGCASGFLAWGLSPRVGHYLGLDVAPRAIEVARELGLANAEFRVADGTRLPLADNSFDAAICYDVFTNFPDFQIGEAIILEMLRVVKPGGKVLIGSIPDGAKREQYEQCVAKVVRELDERYGPPPKAPDAPVLGLADKFRQWLNPIEPQIVCYYFNREDFIRLGEKLGVNVELADIHSMNPYVGFRFNAIFTKNGR